MARYWITFRIESDDNYQERYDGLREAIVEIRKGSWSESTSFWLLSTDLAIEAALKKITASLDEFSDMLIICNLQDNDARYFGVIDRVDIVQEYLPSLK